jgi:hypothetical protein
MRARHAGDQGQFPMSYHGSSVDEQRSRVVAIVAIGIALSAITLALAYMVGAFVLGVMHRVL